MRRKDREMNAEFALAIADKCEWAIMGMVDVNGMPYCIPLSIARFNNAIYFHSAKEGLKIECLKHDSNVCITCVGDTYRMPNEFTTEYESAIITGNAYEITNVDEKIFALKLICERHTPLNMYNFKNAINQSLHRTAVWKIEIGNITGKRKKYGKDGKELKFGALE